MGKTRRCVYWEQRSMSSSLSWWLESCLRMRSQHASGCMCVESERDRALLCVLVSQGNYHPGALNDHCRCKWCCGPPDVPKMACCNNFPSTTKAKSEICALVNSCRTSQLPLWGEKATAAFTSFTCSFTSVFSTKFTVNSCTWPWICITFTLNQTHPSHF